MRRLALLSDAASLATKLERKICEIESWLDDISAEDSMVTIDHDVYTDSERFRVDRQSVTVRTARVTFTNLLILPITNCYFNSSQLT